MDKGSKRPTETPAKLSEDLHRWLTSTMQFKGYGKNKTVPTVEELKTLVGPNLKIWRHVVQNILPSETVRKIRGNLMWSSDRAIVESSGSERASGGGDDDDELNELLRKKSDLDKELSEIDKFNSVVEHELESIKKEFSTNGQNHRSLMQNVTDDSCLRRATEGVTERIKRDEEKVKEMLKLVEEIGNILEKLMSSTDQSSTKERDGSDSKCMSRLKQCLFHSEQICRHRLLDARHRRRDTSAGGDCGDVNHEASLIQSARSLMDDHSAEEILLSLTRLISQSNNQLKKMSNTTFAFPIEKVSTEKNQTSFNDGHSKFFLEMKQLFNDSRIETIKIQTDTDAALNASMGMCQLNERNEKVVEQLVIQRYSERRNCQQAALKLLKVMKKLATSRAVHSSLKSQVDRLSEKIEGIERKQDVLAETHDKIMIFNEMVKEKQDLMQRLALENFEMKSSLKWKQEEVVQYVSNNLIGQDEKWVILANQLGCLSAAKEVEIFRKIGLQNYMLLSLDQSQASIHRSLSNPEWLFSSALLRILESLKFPHYQNLDELMPHVTFLHLDLMSKELKKKNHKSSCTVENYYYVKEIVDELQDLCNKVKEKEHSHIEHYEPMLRNRTTNVTQSLVACQRVDGIISDWWNMPARAVLPWIVVDDMNMQQWLDKWKVACSKLRQASLK